MTLSQVHPHTEPQRPKGVTSFALSTECQYSSNCSVQRHVSFCTDASITPTQTHRPSLLCNTKLQFQTLDPIQFYTIPQSPHANLMEYSWEAINFSPSQKILHIFRYQKVQYHVCNRLQNVPILRHINPVHTLPFPVSLRSLYVIFTHNCRKWLLALSLLSSYQHKQPALHWQIFV